MYNRDRGAEDLASDQNFAWPPAGFRERRSNFTKTDPVTTASASSTSSPRRQQRPSSDQVIQQFRDELDKHRQMFFDRLPPQWDSAATQRAGFPFTDTARRAFSGIDRMAPTEDIPATWMEDDAEPSTTFTSSRRQRWPSSGSGRSSNSGSSGGGVAADTAPSSQRSDSPNRPRAPKQAARSATGDFPSGSSPAASPKGFCRASSAPPQAVQVEERKNPQQSTDSPGPTRRPSVQQQQSGNHVRHIPIMVEGRDEPLLPSVAEEENAEKRSKTAIPMPFYPEKKSVASSPTSSNSRSSRDKERGSSSRPNDKEARDGSVPIPLPYDRLSDDSGRSVGSTASADLQTVADLEQIRRIQHETEAILPAIEDFHGGDRTDRGFLFLDEMLTRLLLKLDNVQVEGREDVRQARKEAIASITRCINLLESKLQSNIDREPAVADEQQPEEMMDTAEAPTHVTQLVINIPFREPTEEQQN